MKMTAGPKQNAPPVPLPAPPPLEPGNAGLDEGGKEAGLCRDCPYARPEGCVGICMRMILREWREKRRDIPCHLSSRG